MYFTHQDDDVAVERRNVAAISRISDEAVIIKNLAKVL